MTFTAFDNQVALVVAAHPDDEVLGCGATMARLADSGWDVHVMIMSRGVTSRRLEGEQARLDLQSQLEEEARAACGALGVGSVRFEDLPDNSFDTVPLLSITQRIEAVVADLKPAVVFTHSAADLNQDHVLTHRAVLTATRPLVDQPVEAVFAFEVLSSTEWADAQPFEPTVYLDVEHSIDRKVEAMSLYASELREPPHPRSLEGVRAQARVRGLSSGMQYAEAFELVRWRMLDRRLDLPE